MAVEVVMPQMGESIFEGTITKWLKKPGDQVERDEPLFEISTDKVDAEIPSPAAGVLREIKSRRGADGPRPDRRRGDRCGRRGCGDLRRPAQPSKSMPCRSDSEAAPERPSSQRQAAARVRGTPRGGDGERSAARRWCGAWRARNNIDLAKVRGTGAGGRISKRIFWRHLAQAARTARQSRRARAPAPRRTPSLETAVPRERIYFGHYQVQPMSVMRQRIAEHMVLSKRVSPHVYSIDEADMTHIAQLRDGAKDEFEKRHETKLTFMPFFVRACAEALREFPLVNASVDGTNVVLHGEINIGIAVALEAGLIVPVVKNAGEKNFVALQRAINDLAERARAKKLKPEEVQESTFSITNPGIFGGLMGLPVINQPNVAILAIGAIQKRPVVVDDAIAIRSMVYLALSYDHRIVDGAIGAPVHGPGEAAPGNLERRDSVAAK